MYVIDNRNHTHEKYKSSLLKKTIFTMRPRVCWVYSWGGKHPTNICVRQRQGESGSRVKFFSEIKFYERVKKNKTPRATKNSTKDFQDQREFE